MKSKNPRIGDYSISAILLGTIKPDGMAKIFGETIGGYPAHYGNCTWHILANSCLETLVPASINHGKGIGPVMPNQEIPPPARMFPRREIQP